MAHALTAPADVARDGTSAAVHAPNPTITRYAHDVTAVVTAACPLET